MTVGLTLVVIVPPPALGTGVPPTDVGVAAGVFAGEILVVIFGWEALLETTLADEPPVTLVVIVPPLELGTGVPAMGVAVVLAGFAGEILVVITPGWAI